MDIDEVKIREAEIAKLADAGHNSNVVDLVKAMGYPAPATVAFDALPSAPLSDTDKLAVLHELAMMTPLPDYLDDRTLRYSRW